MQYLKQQTKGDKFTKQKSELNHYSSSQPSIFKQGVYRKDTRKSAISKQKIAEVLTSEVKNISEKLKKEKKSVIKFDLSSDYILDKDD